MAGAHDRPAHGIPDVHEGERPGGVGADALHRRAARPERGEIVADAAALLHGQRRLLQLAEDAGHIVRDRAHDEAVEQGDVARRAGAGEDAPGRHEAEILLRFEEPLFPYRRFALDLRQRLRDPPPGIVDRPVDRRAVRPFQPVFHVPDLLGDGGDVGHRWSVPGRAAIRPQPINLAPPGRFGNTLFFVCFHRTSHKKPWANPLKLRGNTRLSPNSAERGKVRNAALSAAIEAGYAEAPVSLRSNRPASRGPWPGKERGLYTKVPTPLDNDVKSR